MTTTGRLETIVETATGMTVRVIVGYTPPPVESPIYETITDVRPEWARPALRGAVGKTVTIQTDEAGDVTLVKVRA